MLYDTHKRYGQVFGMLALPVAAKAGMIDFSITEGMSGDIGQVAMNVMVFVAYIVVALKASMFGAEFPDLDSPGSTPSKHHPILSKLFKLAGVKHRGKFSHDFGSQLLLWGSIYGVVSFVAMSATTPIELAVMSFVKLYVAFTFVGVVSHLFADALTVDGVWVLWSVKIRFMPVFLRKINVFGWKPCKTWFTTASAWNGANYQLMTLGVYVSAVYVVATMFGWV